MSKPAISSPTPATPAARTFRDLLRNGRFAFTERELKEHLNMGSGTLQRREQHPETLTIDEIFRVADLVQVPVAEVLAVVMAEVRQARPEVS